MSEPFKQSLIRWLMCVVLAAITLAVFFPAANCPYINLDDPDYIINNLHVRQGWTLETVRWAFTSVDNSNWHPLTSLSNVLISHFYGLDPIPQHEANIIVHVLNTVLVFILLLKLTGRQWASALVALLFALHPLHVESVVWVSERKDVLSGFFFFLTLLAYARYVEVRRQNAEVSSQKAASQGLGAILHPPSAIGCYALSLFFFACGLMSKPMLVTVPVVLLLLDFWPLRRFTIYDLQSTIWKPLLVEKIPFFLLTAASCAITILAQDHAIISAADFALTDRLAHIPVAYAWYLFKLVWPVGHSIYYILHPNHPLEWVLLALLLLGGATALALRLLARCPYLMVGWLMFLMMLVPVAGFLQVGSQAYAERYTYLPYLGLFIAIIWGLTDLVTVRWQGKWAQCGLWLAGLLAVGACGKLTSNQIQVWQSSETLFKQAVKQDDQNPQAWIYYGLQFNHAGKTDQAIECMRQALAINPGNTEAWNHLGRMLMLKGEYAEAQKALETALRDGRHLTPAIYKNLADVFVKLGQPEAAITKLEQSLAFKPDQPVVILSVAVLYAEANRLDQAVSQYENLIHLIGANVDAEMGLAGAYGSAGQGAKAIEHYRRALALKPDVVAALNNLAWLLATDADSSLRNGTEAVRLAKRACDLTQNQEAFLIGTLAAAQAETGDFPGAMKSAQQARDVALAHGQKDVAANNERLLETYKSGRAHHESVSLP